MSVDLGMMDDLVLALTASWFATTIWGALFSLAILAFEVRGKSKVTGGTG